MLNPNLKNLLLFIFLKYLLFYVFMMFKNHDYTLISIFHLKTFADWLYYLFVFLSLPIVYCLLFIVMLHYALNTKRLWICVFVIVVVFALEYLVYTWLASTSDYYNGLYNAVIGATVLWLFFYNSVTGKVKTYPTNS